MNRVRFVLPLVCVALGAAGMVARGDAETVSYSLDVPPSALQTGCFGPCDCATFSNSTYGSFDLVFVSTDGLYRYYSVERYIASFNNGPGAVSIVGSGQYKIGGEVAITQQMTLDLQVWGGPVQHFDSGLKPVTTPFPKINVACPLHDFACHDSVVVVDAVPVETAGVPPIGRIAGIEDVRPNPFRRVATIAVDLDHPTAAEVSVYGLDGRRVRRLGAVTVSGAEARTLVWDGRRDDGREAKAGVYWVRVTWPGGADRRRIVKLD